MRDIVINYRTGENEKGLRMNRADVETLLFLFEQKLMAQNQLYEFYSLIKTIHYDSFRKRIGKFAELNLVQIKKYGITKKRRGVATNLIQLTPRGCWLLKRAGFIAHTDLDFNSRTNWDRLLALKEVVLHAVRAEVQKNGVVIGGEIKHLYLLQKEKAEKLNLIPNADELFPAEPIHIAAEEFLQDESFPNSEVFTLKRDLLYSYRSYNDMFPNDSHEKIVVPDWILGINEQLLNIEMDTGRYRTIGESNVKKNMDVESEELKKYTEVNSVKDQMKKYIQFSKQYPLNHSVLYVYLDDSFCFRKNYGRKTQKIKNLKQALTKDHEINNSTLDIYILSLESSRNVVENIFRRFRGELTDAGMINDTFKHLSNNPSIKSEYNDQILNESSIENFHFRIPMGELEIQSLFLYQKKDQKKIDKVLIPISMYEGNIRSQFQLQMLSKELKENKLKWGLPDDSKILAIYPNKESMENDVFVGEIESEQIILFNLEKLAQMNAQAIFYNLTRKDEMTFEEATRSYED